MEYIWVGDHSEIIMGAGGNDFEEEQFPTLVKIYSINFNILILYKAQKTLKNAL